MRSQLTLVALILMSVFLLIAEDISWEKLSFRYIARIGDRTNARNKLAELGYSSELSYENFRYRQLIIVFLISAIELCGSIFFNISLSLLLSIFCLSACTAIYLTEQNLSREVIRYREAIESDFPTIVEALTLSLSAGESPLVSMQRIASHGTGALTLEFSKVVDEVSLGTSFATALDAMGRRVRSIAVRRFVDSIVIAISRGAPLIDVLHGHAKEARDFQRNRILSAASKAELSMMIPVVFLILPISILFALWPSMSNLNLFAQN